MSSTTQKSSITLEAARALLDEAERRATELGKAFAIAVVDESGVLKAFLRMDGAPLLANQVAQDKAYTAVGFGMDTGGWYDFIRDDPPLLVGAPAAIDRLVPFAGGRVVVKDGEVVGAVGVSGGHYSEDDVVAAAAVAAFGV